MSEEFIEVEINVPLSISNMSQSREMMLGGRDPVAQYTATLREDPLHDFDNLISVMEGMNAIEGVTAATIITMRTIHTPNAVDVCFTVTLGGMDPNSFLLEPSQTLKHYRVKTRIEKNKLRGLGGLINSDSVKKIGPENPDFLDQLKNA